MTRDARWSWLLGALLVVTAGLLVSSHTPHGAAISSDSLVYLSVAANVADGLGLSIHRFEMDGPALAPMTTWPPLYPASLSPLAAFSGMNGTQLAETVPWLNFALLALSLLLFFRALAPTPALLRFGACLVLALLPSIQVVYAYAWSETLFIPLTLGSFLLLQRYLRQSSGTSLWLVLALITVALATYVRYVGIAFAAACLLAVLLWSAAPWRRRLNHAALAGSVYSVTLSPLLFRNFKLSGAFSGAERGVPDPVFHQDLMRLLELLYLDTFNLPLAIALALALLTVTLFLGTQWARWNATEVAQPKLAVGLPLLYALSYAAFLLASRTYQRIDLDARMISVAMPFALLALSGLAWRAWRAHQYYGPPLVSLCAVALLWNGLSVHAAMLENLEAQRSPGRLLGTYYPSATDRQFDALRYAADHFDISEGALVLTDISRPQIVQFYFSNARVRQLPATETLSPEQLERVVGLGNALVLVVGADWVERLQGALETVYEIRNGDGNVALIAARLPPSD